MITATRNLALSALLAIGFLSAGAFATHNQRADISGNQNITVILKQAAIVT